MQTIGIYPVEARNFTFAGEASSSIKSTLKQLGVDAGVIRRIAVSAYEAEINLVIHTVGGQMVFEMSDSEICITAKDDGPGIADVDLAMTEGFSTASQDARDMGFGAGMGLPNIRRNADRISIHSRLGEGTELKMCFLIEPKKDV